MNIGILGVPEEREKGAEKLFEEIIKKFSKFDIIYECVNPKNSSKLQLG